QAENVRVLTDSGALALYQKEKAPFVDPWLFRLLVRTQRIEPRQMEQWLESRSYDYLVLTADLYSPAYDDNAFGLPLPLVRKARGRYTQVAYAAGLFIYQAASQREERLHEAQPGARGGIRTPPRLR